MEVAAVALQYSTPSFPSHRGQTGFKRNAFFVPAQRPPLVLVRASSRDYSQFCEASKKGNLIPVFQRIFGDHLTPVLAYRCLVKEDDREAPSFLFESVEHCPDASNVGRYSIIGAQPACEIVAKEDHLAILNHEEGSRVEEITKDPMAAPQRITEKWNPVMVQGLPNAFCGGWVGYFSYDTVRYVETRKLPFSSAPKDDRGLPDMHLCLYKDLFVFDHVMKIVYAIHWVDIDEYESVDHAYNGGKMRLEKLVARIQNTETPRLQSGNVDLSTMQYGAAIAESNMTCEEYKSAVLEAKEHILAGDIFQIVLSQRLVGAFSLLQVLKYLRRITKGKVINRPLAGTRRRGKTPEEDLLLEKDLRMDEKECAEHVMLVDLGRNDVGKVSEAGSVKVEKLMEIERYSHVMHISSTVSGQLDKSLTSWDALRAALPVGTVSGAPKVKAMELIDKLEPTRRGPYGGGIGGISFNGDMDIALALRTMVFPNSCRYDTMYSYNGTSSRREWIVHLQAGAGIVADSKPDDEYNECVNKAAGLGRAIDLAEDAFTKEQLKEAKRLEQNVCG